MKKFGFEVELRNPELGSLTKDIAKARYKLTLPTQKLLIYLLSDLKYKETEHGREVIESKFEFNDMLKLFEDDPSDTREILVKRLLQSLYEIKENSICYIYRYPNGIDFNYVDYPWYSKVEYTGGDTNEFIFRFNYLLLDILLDLKENYINDVPSNIKLKSKYAAFLYGLIQENEFQKKPQRYSTEELKKALHADKKTTYERWDLFKRDVLDKAVDQVSRNTNYIITSQLERVGRFIKFINFHLTDKEVPQDLKKYLLPLLEEDLQKTQKKGFLKPYKLNQHLEFIYSFEKNLCIVKIYKESLIPELRTELRKALKELFTPLKKDLENKNEASKEEFPSLKKYFNETTTFKIK